MLTDYHAKYFAYELTRRRRGSNVDRIGQSLFDASVDLNPHQIDAALYALQNPLNKGVILADEVGLGKTIEAALVMAQLWAERQRRIIVICPAVLRRQWAGELQQKFNLPCQVVDANVWRKQRTKGIVDPFDQPVISVISYPFAVRMAEKLSRIPWNLVVFDEAHHLRNAHRNSHRTGQSVKKTFAGSKKLLLTATPLQNSLLELFGLSTVIDNHLFGDVKSFRKQYMNDGGDLAGLKARVQEFIKRTLRRHVNEYIRYTERRAFTVPFAPTEDELRLYHLVSAYMQRLDTYGVAHRHRHLITLVARKLMASSTSAVIQNLERIIKRLKALQNKSDSEADWFKKMLEDDDFDEEWFGEVVEDEAGESEDEQNQVTRIDHEKLQAEIIELEQYVELARRIKVDAKSKALLLALEQGFASMAKVGAARKAVIFTESRRTQNYLLKFLESHGYAGKVIAFSGKNEGLGTKSIYQRWLAEHRDTPRVTGSPAMDRRTALIDYFRSDAEIMIATEAAAEGVNLQFCSMVINYDLPWNPQRVEQRIGRCHRYGQKHDVVVINFLNKKNEADKRVLELLKDKFCLFDGLFGASDEVLGRIESGVDFEKRIAAIYQSCRTEKEIKRAFDALQKELEKSIDRRMDQTRQKLLEHFDEQIHELLKSQHKKAEQQLSRMQRLFWLLTRHRLHRHAHFSRQQFTFELHQPPILDAPQGEYALIQKGREPQEHQHLYRMSHPLGEYVLDSGRRLITPVAQVSFDLGKHPKKVSLLNPWLGKSGWLELNQLALKSFADEEYLVFTAISDCGEVLDSEFCEALFRLQGRVEEPPVSLPAQLGKRLDATVKRQIEARLSKALEENEQYFRRERQKLEDWAEDMLMAAEQALEDVRIKLKQAKREARHAETLEEQKEAEVLVQKHSRLLRRKRQELFDAEDEIEARRDEMIAALDKRMHQQSSTAGLFRIRWRVI